MWVIKDGCGETGVVLQSRGSGFRVEADHPNVLAPRKRPLHTIIPALLVRDGQPWMAFGVMGGDVQPQAHLAFVSNVVDHGLIPRRPSTWESCRSRGRTSAVRSAAPSSRLTSGPNAFSATRTLRQASTSWSRALRRSRRYSSPSATAARSL